MMNINSNGKIDKSPEKIAGMFDRIAPRYDFLNHLLSVGVDRYWRRRTVRELRTRLITLPTHSLPPMLPILDVATGTGDLAIALFRGLRKASHDEISVTGVDFSEEMLRRAQIKAERLGLSRFLSFQRADGLALPFPDNSFAAVTIAFGLRNMADTDRGIAEMTRVCANGGIVAILEFSMPSLPVLSSLYKFYFQTMLPRIGRLFSRRSDTAYAYLPASVADFDRIPAMKTRLAHAGLTEIEAFPLTFGVAALYLGRK